VTQFSDDDEDGQVMKKLFFSVILILGLIGAGRASAQDAGASKSQDNAKPAQDAQPPAAQQSKRLTIEVSGGKNDVAVVDASVYLKYEEARVLRKDKKYALNVKTNRDGKAHIPDVPLGRVLIQVVADGWKSYGQYYALTDPEAVIKIHLERPPKWY